MVTVMLKPEKKRMSPRDKELFMGHLVTWGALISGLALAIALAPVSAADQDQTGSTPGAAVTLDSATSVRD